MFLALIIEWICFLHCWSWVPLFKIKSIRRTRRIGPLWTVSSSLQWGLVRASGFIVLSRPHAQRSLGLQWNMELQTQEKGTWTLFCQKYEMSTILTWQPWECASHSSDYRRLIGWQLQLLSSETHHCVCTEAKLSMGYSQPMTAWSRDAKAILFLGDAELLWGLTWLHDSLMALVTFP